MPSPERKALDYAESLGVNSVYESALETRNKLDEVLNALLSKREERRAIEASRVDREFELLQDEGIKNPSLSVAAMDRHLKVVYHEDSTLRSLRATYASLTDWIDSLEARKTIIEYDLKVSAARLNELGGYFQYLAALKTSSEARKASEAQSQDPNPWR